MKLKGMAAILSMAMATTAAVACSTESSSPSVDVSANNPSELGQVGLALTLPNGVTIPSVHWEITATGFTTRSGDVNVGSSNGIQFIVGNLPQGAGYTITLSATDSGGDGCLGSATFAVTAGAITDVSLNLVCTVGTDASVGADVSTGNVAIDAGVTFNTLTGATCPGISSFQVIPAEVQVGRTMGLTSTALAGSGAGTFAWTVAPAAGSTGAATIDTANQASANLTCTAAGKLTLTLKVDAVGGGCAGKNFTTLSHLVTCDASGTVVDAGPADAAPDVTTIPDATPDVGTAPDAAPDAARDAAPDAPTDSGPAQLTSCNGNAGGLCTPTEALLINTKGQGCYDCLLSVGCINDTTFGDSNNECGDVAGNASTGTSRNNLCLSLISCITSTSCASKNVADCYCGSAAGTACTNPSGQNGACLAQEQAAIESTDPVTINNNYSNKSLGGGMANQVFSCAAANSCSQCL